MKKDNKMECPFAQELAVYRGLEKPFLDHIDECGDCRFAAMVLINDVQNAPCTSECPEGSMLAAYDEGILNGNPEYAQMMKHIEDCSFCRVGLVRLKREETSLEESRIALESGDAYLIAQNIKRSRFIRLPIHLEPMEKRTVGKGLFLRS